MQLRLVLRTWRKYFNLVPMLYHSLTYSAFNIDGEIHVCEH